MAARSSTKASTKPSLDSWRNWPEADKLALFAALRAKKWQQDSRPSQRPPAGTWRTWYIRGGRGSGKTRTGAETFTDWVLGSPPGDWAIIAPTYGDARDTCVEGESGMLEALGPAVETWNRSLGELRVKNGARIHIDGADDGALRIQGKNLRGAWCDEVGLWREWKRAWEESIAFAVRIDPARIIATGTPKGSHGIVKLLMADGSVAKTHLRTKDNATNLSQAMLDALVARYGGTRLGRQELEGEVLDDVEGALWSSQLIEDARVEEAPELRRIVVGVDPAVSNNRESDETGIVVVGIASRPWEGSTRDEAYVLADRSGRRSPKGWARRAIRAYEEFAADRIVPERNNGGDMVEATIRAVDMSVPVESTWASRGKRTRAEPVSALYEQGRVHHVGAFPELEDQLTGWDPNDSTDSPDRLDALVWAVTDLMLGKQSSWRPL